jgi:alkylation response protein AidB-like acyl-CoA dehydrogenase
MDFMISPEIVKEQQRFLEFLNDHMLPHLSIWYHRGGVSRSFFREMGRAEWFGFRMINGQLVMRSAFREAMVLEQLAKFSPGVAVTILAASNLGLMVLHLFGSDQLKEKYAAASLMGNILICLGNTEQNAGSDVAGISMQAEKVDGGWLLNGSKAYVTNGFISDLVVVTAVTHPKASRNWRLSMFMVDMHSEGVQRKKLNKRVWIPSDLTRIQFNNVFVPEDHLMGKEGRGLQQVLTVFTHSRIPISAMTLGTAVGAFNLAFDHSKMREVFGKKVIEFQSKAFEAADLFAQMEAARLMIWKASSAMDSGSDFRLEASMTKYLTVKIAKTVTSWAADLFGAASVIFEHPIHKFPMDAWASSLGEGTQDVQKLVIFRELMKKYGKK